MKGKTEPVSIYECMDHHTEETCPNLMDVMGLFADGLQRYRAQDFTRARERFLDVLKARVDDVPAATYIERCDVLLKDPPPEDWDGVWIMTEK